MSQCNECGKNADELWSMPGEYGRTEFVCNDCVPKPGTHDITGEYHLCCPACKSTKSQEVSEQYWFSRPGGLFHCERSHLFTITQIERYFNAVVVQTCLNEALGCILVHLIHITNAQQSLTQWVY